MKRMHRISDERKCKRNCPFSKAAMKYHASQIAAGFSINFGTSLTEFCIFEFPVILSYTSNKLRQLQQHSMLLQN